jgi:SAM-dependent methyltransferase
MATTPEYLKPYTIAEQLYGPTFGATLWNSRASQRIRFQVMAEIFPLAARRVLDAGCGTGDFLAFLEEVGQLPAAYTGIDALPTIIDEARRRAFRSPAEFIVGDIIAQPGLLATGQAEVICISGTLNTLKDAHFYAALDHAFDSASQCLLFNFLSTKYLASAAISGTVMRHDPAEVFAHGLKRTGRIIVRHDYYEARDCTMAWLRRA